MNFTDMGKSDRIGAWRQQECPSPSRVPGGSLVRVMTAHAYTLFDTAIGRCAIAWGGGGILAVRLPEARDGEMRARLHRQFPEAREAPPPPEVQRAVDAIVGLLRGEARDLSSVALDMNGVPPFHRRVYDVARTIPPGET